MGKYDPISLALSEPIALRHAVLATGPPDPYDRSAVGGPRDQAAGRLLGLRSKVDAEGQQDVLPGEWLVHRSLLARRYLPGERSRGRITIANDRLQSS
jgi:hypothetical protein